MDYSKQRALSGNLPSGTEGLVGKIPDRNIGFEADLPETPEYHAGIPGPPGPQGLKGDPGPIGPAGPAGVKGDTGPQGPAGNTGPQGPKGDQGPQGEKGKDGYTPVKGVDYFDGKDGAKGDKGDTGPQGESGAKGDPGPTGATGPAGHTPQKGTDYWTDADKAEIVEEVLSELPAPEGSGSKWIQIGDVEITEEGVFYLKFTTDINGNAFSCRRIVANFVFPSEPTSKGITMSVEPTGNSNVGEIFANNINAACRSYYMSAELIPGGAVIFDIAQNNASKVFYGLSSGRAMFTTKLTELTCFAVRNGYGSTDKLPIGTTLNVWGLTM